MPGLPFTHGSPTKKWIAVPSKPSFLGQIVRNFSSGGA
jgi:hypothetical protein